MKNALARIVKTACGVMKKPLAAAHEECAGAHYGEGEREPYTSLFPLAVFRDLINKNLILLHLVLSPSAISLVMVSVRISNSNQ